MTRSNSVILFLWFGYLSATTAMGYSVVKTESYVCDSPNAVIRGSGLIFKDEGKYFVPRNQVSGVLLRSSSWIGVLVLP